MDLYPKTKDKDTDPNTPWIHLSTKQLFLNTIKTAIDIINDISEIFSQYHSSSTTSLRRRIVDTFLQENRRVYVGFWILIFAFILYFIDLSS